MMMQLRRKNFLKGDDFAAVFEGRQVILVCQESDLFPGLNEIIREEPSLGKSYVNFLLKKSFSPISVYGVGNDNAAKILIHELVESAKILSNPDYSSFEGDLEEHCSDKGCFGSNVELSYAVEYTCDKNATEVFIDDPLVRDYEVHSGILGVIIDDEEFFRRANSELLSKDHICKECIEHLAARYFRSV